MSSLDEVQSPFEALQPDPILRGVLSEFWKSPERVLVGTGQLDFPISLPHMYRHCLFWRLATEAGDRPHHVLTETDVRPNDTKFLRAWLIVNGLAETGPNDLRENIYLDYLLFARKGDQKETNYGQKMKELAAKINMQERLFNEAAKQADAAKKRADQEDGEQEAMELMAAFAKFMEEKLAAPSSSSSSSAVAFGKPKPLMMPLVNGKPMREAMKVLKANGMRVVRRNGPRDPLDGTWLLGVAGPKRAPPKRKLEADAAADEEDDPVLIPPPAAKKAKVVLGKLPPYKKGK